MNNLNCVLPPIKSENRYKMVPVDYTKEQQVFIGEINFCKGKKHFKQENNYNNIYDYNQLLQSVKKDTTSNHKIISSSLQAVDHPRILNFYNKKISGIRNTIENLRYSNENKFKNDNDYKLVRLGFSTNPSNIKYLKQFNERQQISKEKEFESKVKSIYFNKYEKKIQGS